MSTRPIPLIAIIDSNAADLAETRRILTGTGQAQVVSVARAAEEIPRLLDANPDVVLLDVGSGDAGVPALIASIHEYGPRCEVILTAAADAPIDLLRDMRAGARGVVRKPIAAQELLVLVQEVFDAEQRRLDRIEAVAVIRATRGRAGEVITVFSPKGGTGCSVLASHLALALAGSTGSRVALVDFSLQFGDIGLLLNLHSPHGLQELLTRAGDLDNTLLDSVMVPHQSGIRVLLAPPSFAQAMDVTTDSLVAVLDALRRYNDFVIVDTWHSMEDATLAIMDASDVVVLVTTPEVPALRHTRRAIDFLRQRAELGDKLRIVVNQYAPKGAVDSQGIVDSLGMTPIGVIPSDPVLVGTAVNEGVPFVPGRTLLSKALTGLATTLAEPRMARQHRATDPAPTAVGWRPTRLEGLGFKLWARGR